MGRWRLYSVGSGADPVQQSGFAVQANHMDGLLDADKILLGDPLADQGRGTLVISARSQHQVQELPSGDPGRGSHVLVDRVERWAVVLDGRSAWRPGPLLPESRRQRAR